MKKASKVLVGVTTQAVHNTHAWPSFFVVSSKKWGKCYESRGESEEFYFHFKQQTRCICKGKVVVVVVSFVLPE